MSNKHPRRRDVRELVDEVFSILSDNRFDDGKFTTSFLTSVRNYMRNGTTLADAILRSGGGMYGVEDVTSPMAHAF